MIKLHNICLSFGNQKIFDHINYIFNKEEHVGLVGANGAGKSTLLKAISKSIQLDAGSIEISKQMRIAYIPQDILFDSAKTVVAEALSTIPEVGILLELHQKYEDLIAKKQLLTDTQWAEFAEITAQLAPVDCTQKIKEVYEILNGLGFTQHQLYQLVNQLSVGWKMRLLLAKMLLQKADFYLFDEPTNHLDIVAKDWFLQFLRQASCGFIFVSHDRYFLDHACTQIFELERGKGTVYQGNYTSYLEQKKVRQELLEQTYIQQQKEIQRKQDTIARFRAGTRAQMSKNIQRSLERMDLVELSPTSPSIHFSFTNLPPSGKIVLTVQHVSFQFAEKLIFNNISFALERQQKIALVAPNGVGKTTLLSLIAGKYPLQNGTIRLGHNVALGFFHQDQREMLNQHTTVFEQTLDNTPQKTTEQIRTMLGAFLFDAAACKKKISVLSGGEKNRLCMAQLLLQDNNFLILDEPTNHLDLQSKELLLHALQQYKGTVFFVSHDRDFINHLATGIIELTAEHAHYYAGNYDEYIYHKNLTNQVVTTNSQKLTTNQDKKSTSNQIELKKEIRKLEQIIAQHEKKIAQLHEQYATVLYATDDYITYQKKLKEYETVLATTCATWESLQHQLYKN